MSLAGTLTVEVGAAIAKAILKLWVKNSSLGEDISSNLIDLLKSRTSDALAQQRGRRQFETIGEKVGESLLPLFESEGTRLDEDSRTAIALAVAEAFNKSQISTALLAEYNLEPTKLSNYVMTSHPAATRDFSAEETAFYKRIVAESCRSIVDIASQLPVFNERTFAEVLSREDQLIARADQVLQEVRRVREQLNPMLEAGRFEIDYRLAVARNLDVLQLLGTDVSTANRRYRLSVAYITLSAAQKSSTFFKNRSLSSTVTTTAFEDSGDKTGIDVVSVEVALARSRRLFIRGPAGSGKTTLLQWIAVRSASKSFSGLLSDWNKTLPFYIRLRQCVQTNLPSPEAFPGLVTPAIAGTMPKGWVHEQLKSGRAIVLIDGVDEIPTLKRENVRTWLKELVETYPKARFIITSRPHAVEEGWMDREGFGDDELQPMQLSDIYTFIDYWHKAVREGLSEDEEKAELEPLAEHLKDDLRHNRSIRNVAANPLLCAMLCALNRDRKQQLPSDRIELYEACCYLLLERRDKSRGVDLTDFPAFNYRQKSLLLEDLAYWMIKNEWSQLALQRLDERFARKLTNMPGIFQDVSGSAVRRLFVERSGIIRELVKGQIDFTHRTFQEFLASKAASDEMDIGVLVANGHNDQWREVIILTSGLAPKQMREELIKGLIDRGDKEKEHRYHLHFLAVSCLETSIELGQEVKAEVENRLAQLVPPIDMTDAQSLAAAGELAVKHLAKGKHSDSTNAACVRALSIIGSEAALEMLEGYTNEPSSIVVDELVRAWDYFDRELYAKRVLSQTFLNKTWLNLGRLPSFNGIQYFTNLISLELSDCNQVNDLSPLTALTQLTSLNVSGCSRLSDLSPLAALTQLTSLNLSGCSHLNDLSPLADLTQLTSLNLSGCNQVGDLSFLIGLSQLTSLNLSGCAQVSTLDLAGLAELASLDLSGCSYLHTLRLIDLPELTILNLSGCAQVDTLDLAGLPELTSLDLSSCSHLNTLRLTDLPKLTSLDLSGFSHLSTLNLINLPHLSWIFLSGCSRLNDLSPLAALTQLTSLSVFYCDQVQDLSPLIDLKQLRSLSLSGCDRVSDLSLLTNLTQLTTLKLSGCAQVDTLDLVGLPELASLDLSGCSHLHTLRLTDLSKLSNLKLSGCARVGTIDLAGLPELASLDLSGCSHLHILRLIDLPELTSLNLSRCNQVSDFSFLIGLIQLTSLNLAYCFKLRDLSQLAILIQLESLSLAFDYRIDDLSPLAKLTHLTSLDLSNCDQVNDLSSLGNLIQLTSLNLSRCNQVRDISPLAKLKQLASINLAFCYQIHDLSALTMLNRLEQLTLSRSSDMLKISASIKGKVRFI